MIHLTGDRGIAENIIGISMTTVTALFRSRIGWLEKPGITGQINPGCGNFIPQG